MDLDFVDKKMDFAFFLITTSQNNEDRKNSIKSFGDDTAIMFLEWTDKADYTDYSCSFSNLQVNYLC